MSRHDLARKINEKARDAATRARNVHRAVVVRTNPLVVELVALDLVLDESNGDLDRTAWVEFYDREFGIEKGDIMVLLREGGDWTATDVRGDVKKLRTKKLADVDA